MEPIISFHDFSFQYYSQKEPTLYDIDLDIYPGEKILIVGPSGCGKSTLAHCINGLIPYSYKGTITGTIRVAGKTGTAETSSSTANSLFVGFAPYDQPTLAISICIEGSENTEVNGVATRLAGQILATCLNIQAWGA